MFKTSYLREVRKEKYERSDVFEEPEEEGEEEGRGVLEPGGGGGPGGGTALRPSGQGWESLQELNERFARYISRARVLEQRNAVFRKQLETLQRLEEAPGLEEAFEEQISLHRRRVRDLASDRARLERERRDAERTLDEFHNKYRNECEYQQQLRSTLEQLNKEADAALLRNLEYQIESQFLQDDISSTRDRHKKNLAEIQTYVKILNQINQTPHRVPNISLGFSEEQEKLLVQRRVPALRSQLEEYKSALCQLQAQKQRLQTETSVLEQAIKNTQESYDDEIQLYNEQIESLRKEIEEAERSLEKYTNECRQLAMYQTSLENELERYKRIIENEDTRLNSAIIGTPVDLLTTDYRHTPMPSAASRGRDITQAMQDITNIKPRQKNTAKKASRKRELSPKDVMDSGAEEKAGSGAAEGTAGKGEEPHARQGSAPDDVPDGAQISKAFDSLCNIVRDRMRRYMHQEPIADFYTKGRYVLVSGDSSYQDPCFYSSSPSGGHVFVTICNGMAPYDDLYRGAAPRPHPGPMRRNPAPPPSGPADRGRFVGKGGGGGNWRGAGDGDSGAHRDRRGDPQPCPKPTSGPRQPSPAGGHRGRGQPASSPSRSSPPVDSMSYEKVEVVESVEKISSDNKVRGYEETATIVETTIEKTSKKKRADGGS
ncbi:filensin [Scleropages formosus]|uniref:filensin n=1 Tax=Scleropages formosus TaxID=113540 RepID=UPI00062F095D|nr:filensin [Scleropages formosus]